MIKVKEGLGSEMEPHRWLPEPMLSFHPTRSSDCSPHPLEGLSKYGPHSSGLVQDPIRVATLAPWGEQARLFQLLRELKQSYSPKERRDYLPQWPGFRSIFGIEVAPAPKDCRLELDSGMEEEFQAAAKPHVTLADRLVRSVADLRSRRSEFDVLFIYIPKRWEAGFSGGPDDDFDLHDHLKAYTARIGLPLQLVREDKAVSYGCRASVMWRLGLALYAKAGGIPWKLAETDPETAYIGISYALRKGMEDERRFVTCCSQVFDAEGAGLEFVAYNAREVDVRRDNPFLSRTEMFRVMTRSMDLYRRRHAGVSPRRVMVHKSTEFKEEEVDGCLEALHLCEAVDLIEVVSSTPWRGVRLDKPRGGPKGRPANFPVERGTVVGVGGREALLWTHGDVRDVTSKPSYFQGARSTPRPIRLVRHAGHGTWDDTARAILGLTKMNWNNDSLYDPLPVTMGFASVLAGVVKRIDDLRDIIPYQFRFFM